MVFNEKKILLISNMYPNEKYPNYGVFVKNTEDLLKKNDYIIDRVIITKETNKLKKIYSYIRHYLKIICLGRNKKYSLIYVHYASHNAIPILILKKLKNNINLCTNIHGGDVVPRNKTGKLINKFTKKLLKISDIVISPSENYKQLLINNYGISKDKIEVFPSGGINGNIFYPQNEHIVENKCIGFVGRIEQQKGWEVFLDLVNSLKDDERFKDYKYIVVGSGDQSDKFNDKVKLLGLGDMIEKYEMLKQDTLREIYNKMDIFCFPSFNESLGLVGIEAMSCGLPVIGSRVGGLQDYIIDDVNGYMFEKGNVSDMKDKLIKYIEKTDDEKAIIRKNAIRTAKKFEVGVIDNILIELFRNLIRK